MNVRPRRAIAALVLSVIAALGLGLGGGSVLADGQSTGSGSSTSGSTAPTGFPWE